MIKLENQIITDRQATIIKNVLDENAAPNTDQQNIVDVSTYMKSSLFGMSNVDALISTFNVKIYM